MKFDFKTIVIVALLLLIIAGIIFWPKPQPSETIIQARDSIQRITEANRILAMNARTLETQLVETQVKFRSDSAAYKSKISNLEVKLSKKREKVVTIIQENPDLADFVATADTVIFTMRQRIDSLEAEKAFQAALYNDLIYVSGKQITNLEMVVFQKDIVIKDQEKALRKRNRGAKLWKAAAVVGTIGGFLFGTSL